MNWLKAISLAVVSGSLLSACGGGGFMATAPGSTTITSSAKTSEGAVSFNVSAPSGGSATTGYTVICSASGVTTRTGTAAASPVVVLGLENEKAYSCSATASNSVGVGAAGVTYSLTLPRVSAEGFWGKDSPTSLIVGVVLENGDNWFFNFQSSIINTGWQGSGISSAGKYTASNEVFFNTNVSVSTPTLQAPLTGEYVAMKTFNGTIAIPNQSAFTFSANYDSAYETPATLTKVSGVWKSGTGASSVNMTVGANGALTVLFGGACTASGSIIPRPSGKNVYNVKFTVGGSPCSNQGVVVEGIGFIVKDGTSTDKLIIGALDSTRSLDKALLGAFQR
jgi:hypothetical protein